MFQISTLLHQAQEAMQGPQVTQAEVETLEARAAAKGEEVKAAKAEQQENPGDKGTKKRVKALVAELLELKGQVEAARGEASRVGGLPWTAEGEIDYSKDFFGQPAHLTVSGQLQGEDFACALTSIYTFGPTFRAENSHTTRHLAEFWMIEPELAFADLNDDMDLAEDYVRYCCHYLLEHCAQDLAFFEKMVDKTCVSRLRQVAETPFTRITYTKAVEMLQDAVKSKKKKFVNKVEWGCDLNSEHERYLAEEVFKGPMVVYNYPKEIKAFYMRLNDDDKTVAAMDILVPGVGELVGGSQREERLDVLERRLAEDGMDPEPYQSYMDLRRYGTVKHAGFGLGFERLVMFATGLENIRDVIPFPRWPGKAD
jgi:asparaginyl-tRNA synthetase